MAESSVRPSAGGVARRRRERRLRSWWRHEQQTVRMALAAASHHSAQQNAARRGPKSSARAREGEVHEKNDAPRRQNAPHPGERPGSLFDPGPQRSDRSLRRSAGDSLPTLALPVLAGSAGEAVDSSSLRFLTAAALRQRKEEEKKAPQVAAASCCCDGASAALGRVQQEEEEEEAEEKASENLFLAPLLPCSSWTRSSTSPSWCKGNSLWSRRFRGRLVVEYRQIGFSGR